MSPAPLCTGNIVSEDGQEWKIQRLVVGDKRYQCQRCGKYFCERQLLQFEDEVVCFGCCVMYKFNSLIFFPYSIAITFIIIISY